MYCNGCGSEDLRKISLIYEEGTSRIDSHAHGIGVGTRGVSIGMGRGASHVQSSIAARCAPPSRLGWGTWTAALTAAGAYMGCAMLAQSFDFPYQPVWGLIVLTCTAPFAVAAYAAISYNQRRWPQLYARWEASYLCLRCGAIGVPADDDAEYEDDPDETISDAAPHRALQREGS